MKENLNVGNRVDLSTLFLNLGVAEDESYAVRTQGTGGATSAVWYNTFVCCGSVLILNYYPATCVAAFVCESSMNCRDCVHTILAGEKVLHLFSTNINFYRAGRYQKVARYL